MQDVINNSKVMVMFFPQIVEPTYKLIYVFSILMTIAFEIDNFI